jgi:hypothetical protein
VEFDKPPPPFLTLGRSTRVIFSTLPVRDFAVRLGRFVHRCALQITVIHCCRRDCRRRFYAPLFLIALWRRRLCCRCNEVVGRQDLLLRKRLIEWFIGPKVAKLDGRKRVGDGRKLQPHGARTLLLGLGRGRALDFTTLAALWAGPMRVP